jgi:hypothetical protein
MGDRTDIDALLIGALYGELAPAEAARLAAHLESHPADRTALSDLTRTRHAVHDSRMLAVQLEPPPSVSAILLREAARCAPAPARAEGWFARFTHAFMAHPAMAAAAMFVLVVGVSGTLYIRGDDQFAEPRVASPAPMTSSAVASAPEASRREIGRAEATVDQGAAHQGGEPARDAEPEIAAQTRSGGGSAYRVDVDGNTRAVQPADRKADALAKDVDRFVGLEGKSRASAPAAASIAADRKDAQGPRGIAVNVVQPSLEPKELADGADKDDRAHAVTEAPAKNAPTTLAPGADRAEAARSGPAGAVADQVVASDRARLGASPGGGASSSATSTGRQPAPAAPVASKLEGAADQTKTKTSAPTSPSAAPPPAASAGRAAPRDARFASDADDVTKRAEETAVDQGVLAWAQRQRAQVIAYVKANNCRAAASTAVAIYDRAPDYYATSVASDRELKPCIQYVAAERERSERSRAAKRATSTDSPAAPPAKPPPARK